MLRSLSEKDSPVKRSTPAFLLTVCVVLLAIILSTLFPQNGASAQVSGTFGETAVLPNDDFANGNLLVAQQAVLSQNATLQSLSFYVTNAVGRLALGVYADTGGTPGTLLAQTAIFTPAIGWNTQNVLSPVDLLAGAYWLAYLPESNSLHFRLAYSGSARWARVQFGPLPATFAASPQSGVYHWSFYATVLLNATPTSTPAPVPTATSTPFPASSPTPTATSTSLPVSSPTPTATSTTLPASSPTPTSTSTSLPTPTPTSTGGGGNLTFAPKIDFIVGTGPTSAAVGDLDGDGKPDLAVANYGTSTSIGNTLSVLKNNSTSGSITFAPKVDFPTGAGPHGVAMGDLDGDGKPDLAVAQYGANGSGNWVAVLRNTSTIGSISLAARQEYAAGTGPHDIAIGDLDGDGKPDLVVTNFADGAGTTVNVLRNTSTVGNISFATTQAFSVGTGPYGVAIGDINGDGKPDLVVGDTGSISGSGTTISVLQNTTAAPGSISFATKADFQANSGPREVVLRDLDGDGRLDVAVANFGNYDGTTLSVFRNTSSNGNLSLAAKVDLLVGPAPHGLASGDFDGNGLPDLAVTNFGAGNGMSISVLQNGSAIGSVTFAPRLDLTTNAGPIGAAVGDLDGDGRLDIVVTNYGIGNGNTISVLRNLS